MKAKYSITIKQTPILDNAEDIWIVFYLLAILIAGCEAAINLRYNHSHKLTE